MKVDAALQFVPKNTDPKEFKNLQKQVGSGVPLAEGGGGGQKQHHPA